MTDKTLKLTTDEQRAAFDDVLELLDADIEAGIVDGEQASRGRRAGEVTYGEAVRILAEAYRGTLDIDPAS
ncbi:hypothetical protein Z052_01980 [Halorubrum sp. C191]|uniref:hypothetical protein n=1 Tax=Halorubrum sp. C191 TaxID=1383842 RepID=UPI000C07211B|nr:hypothetical protein [Halorubrum sp. C191]PHQ43932.1 hypothetical protein Z052_01980 [Halorubrum sp. C191]